MDGRMDWEQTVRVSGMVVSGGAQRSGTKGATRNYDSRQFR